MERLRFRQHKGTAVLVADFFGLTDEKEIVRVADEITGKIMDSGKKEVRLLVNVTNTVDSSAAQIKFAESAKALRPSCSKIAVIGVTPVKNAVIGFLNKITSLGIRGFSTEIEALDWLVE